MRNLLRRSSLLLVGLLLTTTLLTSDFSVEPAGAATAARRPTAEPSKASFRGRRSTSARRINRRRWRRPSRSAVRVRPRARVVRPKAPKAVQANAAPAADVWARLRQCESGGRYTASTGNGFYGAYQFHPRTWRGLGYPGLPHQAPPEMQDAAARKLQARSGWGQWPACSRRLGLR